MAASARYLAIGGRLRPLRKVDHSADSCIEAETGSLALRLTHFRSQAPMDADRSDHRRRCYLLNEQLTG